MSVEPVLIVGSVAYDDLELPSGVFNNTVGGAATYSAIATSLLHPARVVGIVGEDFDAKTLEQLRARSIDVDGIERAKGKTFRWRGRYAADLNSRETLDTQLNVFAHFQPKILPNAQNPEFLLLGNIHPALQLHVLQQVKKPRFVAADTMNFWISGELETLRKVLAQVDLLIVNDEEARDLSGIHNLPKAARAIQKMGPLRVIIKRGEFGALLFDEAGTFFVPAYPLEDVVDPTGAGDSFAGGLFGYLARTDQTSPQALRKALFFASAAGSFCVEGVGASRLLSMTKDDFRKRLTSFVSLVDYGSQLDLP